MADRGEAVRLVIRHPGGRGRLEPERFDPAPLDPGEVAIDVRAIGVNYADVFCRLGMYKAAPDPPFAPGFEVAGTIEACGSAVTGFDVGDRVLAVTRFGGYSTRVHVRPTFVRPLPAAWSFAQGAAFPVAFLTAWYGLERDGRLTAGETVVVQSAAGGVGTAACQIGRAIGARVIGAVGSDAKRPAALQAGAEHVVVSRRYRVWDDIDRITGGDGVDVILDAVGGPGLRHGYRRLRPGGRLVVYGFTEMSPAASLRPWPLLAWRYLRTPRFDPFRLTFENRSVAGFNLVHLWDRSEMFERAMHRLLGWVRTGDVAPVVSREFPFEDVAAAHAALQGRTSTGKLILVR